MQKFQPPHLLADIGGTHARFAIETGPDKIAQIRVYRCADYSGIAEVIQRYLQDVQISGIHHAAIAIANPIDGDQVQMTNHHWRFSISAMRAALRCHTFLVVNDFTALAMALPRLNAEQLIQIGGGTPQPNGVKGLIGAGTGLGVSGLIPSGPSLARWIALDSEGGHATFAPVDEQDECVWRYARQQWPHVSFERIASGPGIALIYRALAARAGRLVAPAAYDAEYVLARGRAGEPLAELTLDCFCGILGCFAGNIALTLGARGGVYIGGGVVPRLGEFFTQSSFRARFEAKGRFRSYLQKIPTYLVNTEHPTFLGVATLLAQQISES